MIGRQLRQFRIIEKIGAGGMGEVYRAHDEQLDRDVAIKVLPAASFRDETARARLLREARTASKLNHPHICTIHEVGEAVGQAYIAMELVEGQALSARLANGPLPPDQVLRYALQLADALAHAHERAIVHRDLKSANVIVTPQGRAKVLDFGLAKRLNKDELAEATTLSQDLSQPGTIVGTLAYMPPEQLRGEPADARSDVWALGVMLHEMATGTRPFQGKTAFELSSAILNQAPAPLPPELPAELRGLIERCLEKQPAQRYQRGGEVRAVLEAIQSGSAIPAWTPRKPSSSRRRWLVLAAAVAVVVAGAVALDVRGRLLGGGAPPRIDSLAVLPLANLSGDPQQDYFAEDIHEALITDLAKLSGFTRVIARRSVMRYQKTDKPLTQIARELGVAAVLTGSVLREGSRLQITAQLIDAATEQHRWADRYERELDQVLSLQNEIVGAIAREVRLQLTPRERVRLAGARPVNPETYELYLKGMSYLNQYTPETFKQGLDYLYKAVEKDPSDARAWAALATGYGYMGHAPSPAPEALPRAKAVALRALELDDTLAEAHTALAEVKLLRGRRAHLHHNRGCGRSEVLRSSTDRRLYHGGHHRRRPEGRGRCPAAQGYPTLLRMKRPLQWHEIVPARLARERALLTGLPYFNLARTCFDENRRFMVIGSLHHTGQRSGKLYALRVRLEYPRTFPQRVPQVMDHDRVFKPGLAGHLFSTYELCLTLPERGEFSLGLERLTEEVLGAALVWFHKRRLFEVNKTWPGPAERHGIQASIDLLVEQRVATDADVIGDWLLAHASTPSGHPTEPNLYAPCPCGSNHLPVDRRGCSGRVILKPQHIGVTRVKWIQRA